MVSCSGASGRAELFSVRTRVLIRLLPLIIAAAQPAARRLCGIGMLVPRPLLISVSQRCCWHISSSSLCHRDAGATSPPHLCVTEVLLAHPLCCLRILYQNPEPRHLFPCEGLDDVCGYRQELLTLL